MSVLRSVWRGLLRRQNATSITHHVGVTCAPPSAAISTRSITSREESPIRDFDPGLCRVPFLRHNAKLHRVALTSHTNNGLITRGYHALLGASNKQTRLEGNPRVEGVVASQRRDYKVKRKLKKRCPHCYFEKRQGRWYIECKVKPRHKQMEEMRSYKLFGED